MPASRSVPSAPGSGETGEDFSYRSGVLHAEAVSLHEIAKRYGTPCYVYSRAGLEARWRAFDRAFAAHEHLVCFAVKANGNLAVLDVLARLGSGFDIVSGGELARVRAAGGRAERVVFSGCGKSREELRLALEAGIMCFNVESLAELERLAEIAAALGRRAPVSLRVNPDIDARTHPYIATGLKETKFGIPIEEARDLAARARDPRGASTWWASVPTSARSRPPPVPSWMPCGGCSRSPTACARTAWACASSTRAAEWECVIATRTCPSRVPLPRRLAIAWPPAAFRLLIEPGRALVAGAGVLLTRVEYRKRNGARDFAIGDAAMNDLLRPALYDAWHEVANVDEKPAADSMVDVVGPVCESADFLARERHLEVAPGDLLAVRNAGAYAFVMSSNYNARPRAAEVMVDGDRACLVRPRERVEDLFASESRLP